MSSKPRVYVTRRIPEEGIDILRSCAEVRVWPHRLPPSRDVLLREVGEADGLLSLLTDGIDAELIEAAPRLRVISNYAVGYDNIDVPAATARGIWVTNTPGVLTEATADFTFALLLPAARRIVEGDRETRSGGWLTWEPQYLLGADVHGATLGIIGMGRIGEAVARRARGFSMRVLYTDPNPRGDLESALGIEPAALDTLLGDSDFISLHAPLTPDTEHLLGPDAFAAMRRGTILVNTARGELVDEAALVAALRDGTVGAAGLDVYAEEPLPADHPLACLPNVVLAPHLGSATVGARRDMATMAAHNLVAALSGRRPAHPVNSPVSS